MQQSDEPEFDLLERQQIFQRVMRVWHPHLSIAERSLILYLLDNTVSWGKVSLSIKLDLLVHGSGGVPPCGMSRASLYRTLKRLRDRGVVSATSNGRRSTITLNLHWTPTISMLATPKRLKKTSPARSSTFVTDGSLSAFSSDISDSADVSNCDIRSLNVRQQKSQDETADVSNRDVYKKDILLQDIPSQPTLASDARATGGSTARAAISRVKADRKARHAAERSTVSAWTDAWVDAFPGIPCPAWGREDRGMMAKLQTRSAMCEEEWLNFVTWVVGHWPEICALEFAWMTRRAAPARPVPRFIVKFAPKLFDLFASWSTDRRLSLASGDAAELERLVGSGLSQQAALIELGKRKGVAEQREQLDKQRAENLQLLRTAEQTAKRPAPARTHRPLPEVRVERDANPYETGDVDLPTTEHLQWRDE